MGPTRVRISTIQSDPENAEKGSEGEDTFDSNYSPLAKSTVVAASNGDVRRTPTATSETSGSDNIPRRDKARAASKEILQPISLEDLPRDWKGRGIESEAAATMLASWAGSTQKQYNSCLRRWSEYCKQVRIDKIPTEASLLNFLAKLKKEGLGFSSITTHKAAMLAYFESSEIPAVGNSPLVARFMKGLFRERPPKAKYTATWDPEMVLTLLEEWEENEQLNLSDLSRKLVFLLAICSPRRVSELANLRLDSMQVDSRVWTFILNYRNKNRSKGPAHKATYEIFNERPKICPVRCLAVYRRVTEKLRGTEMKLLISPSTRKAVSPITISRWIKTLLNEAGIGSEFGAHSTRSASTSKAARAGIPLQTIMTAACWSNKANTFAQFYRRDLEQTQTFQTSVLSKCVKQAIYGIYRV